MQSVHVDLGDRSYPIYIGQNLIQQQNLLLQHIRGRQVLIVSNPTVADLYLEQIKQSLPGLDVSTLILPDGEQYKNLEVLSTVYDKLLQERHNRSTTLVALGGGVIGDMTGFAAASYQRGVNFIQVPTTLLAQVDSSVGGKTAVNHPLGKNMIGAFYQPRCVLADTDTLKSLPERELSAGMAEVIKYGLIADAEFFVWLEDHIQALCAGETECLTYAIKKSCETKAKVVAADEREGGVRAILNLGHTFGHAIETAQGYGNWLHGEAVAVGILMAAKMSEIQGAINGNDCERVAHLIKQAGLPLAVPAGMRINDFLDLMSVDKKVINGTLRLVLLKRIGHAHVTSNFTEEALRAVLETFCGSDD